MRTGTHGYRGKGVSMISRFYGYSIILFGVAIAFFMVHKLTEGGGLGIRLILNFIVAIFGAVCLIVILAS